VPRRVGADENAVDMISYRSSAIPGSNNEEAAEGILGHVDSEFSQFLKISHNSDNRGREYFDRFPKIFNELSQFHKGR